MIRSKYFITLLFLLFMFGSCGGVSFGMLENNNYDEYENLDENDEYKNDNYDNLKDIKLDDPQHNDDSNKKINLGTTSAKCMKNKFYYDANLYYKNLIENQKLESMYKKSDNIKNKSKYLINKNDEDQNTIFEKNKQETISEYEEAVSTNKTIISNLESNLLTGYKQIKEYQKQINTYKEKYNMDLEKYNAIIEKNNPLIQAVEVKVQKKQLNDNDYITKIISYYGLYENNINYYTKIKTCYNEYLEKINKQIPNINEVKIQNMDNNKNLTQMPEVFYELRNNLYELYNEYFNMTNQLIVILCKCTDNISAQLQNLTDNFKLQYKEEPIPEVEVSILNPYYKNKETCSWNLHKDIIHNKKQILHHNNCKQSLKGIFTKDNRKEILEEIWENLSENKNSQNNDTIKASEYNDNMIKLVELIIDNFEEISDNILNNDNDDILQCINDYLYDENSKENNNNNYNNPKNFYQFLYCKANDVVKNRLYYNIVQKQDNKNGSSIISLFIAGMSSVPESNQDFSDAKKKLALI